MTDEQAAAMKNPKLKAWMRYLVKHLDGATHSDEVAMAIKLTMSKYSVDIVAVMLFLKALSAKARRQHAENEVKNGQG